MSLPCYHYTTPQCYFKKLRRQRDLNPRIFCSTNRRLRSNWTMPPNFYSSLSSLFSFILQAEEDSAATTVLLSIFFGSSVLLKSGLRISSFSFMTLFCFVGAYYICAGRQSFKLGADFNAISIEELNIFFFFKLYRNRFSHLKIHFFLFVFTLNVPLSGKKPEKFH